jgi:hypothetical protein
LRFPSAFTGFTDTDIEVTVQYSSRQGRQPTRLAANILSTHWEINAKSDGKMMDE